LKKVYFISGLGADRRVFTYLDLSFCKPVFIDWIEPLKKESLESYAHRLLALIPENDPAIVGVSFGGMLVTEMAKENPSIKGIIISSNKTKDEFPGYLRLMKFFPVYRWIPNKLLTRTLLTLSWILGVKKENQKKELRKIIIDSDMSFIKWALGSIFNWKNRTVPPNLVHIHGTADKLLPFRFVKADYAVKGGTHVMTMDKANEISGILKSLLK